MAGETILIVEDEEDILDLVDYHVEQAGFKSRKVTAGDRALSMIEKEAPDLVILVILDIMLPGLSRALALKIILSPGLSDAGARN